MYNITFFLPDRSRLIILWALENYILTKSAISTNFDQMMIVFSKNLSGCYAMKIYRNDSKYLARTSYVFKHEIDIIFQNICFFFLKIQNIIYNRFNLAYWEIWLYFYYTSTMFRYLNWSKRLISLRIDFRQKWFIAVSILKYPVCAVSNRLHLRVFFNVDFIVLRKTQYCKKSRL